MGPLAVVIAAYDEAESVMPELEPSVDFFHLTNIVHALNAPFGGIGCFKVRSERPPVFSARCMNVSFRAAIDLR